LVSIALLRFVGGYHRRTWADPVASLVVARAVRGQGRTDVLPGALNVIALNVIALNVEL
jgi:hypothetical protein